MKRLSFLIPFIFLFIGANALGATLSWNAPTTYTDGSTIAAADVAKIVYVPYTGTSATGPWTARPATTAGATSATVPEPAAGSTMWYTVSATLNGQVSAKAPAVSKDAPYKTTSPPTNVKVN